MNLSDINQIFSSDLSVSNKGSLATVDTTQRGQQRVLRRLLTNPGEYIFHPEYGAGLPQWIGRTADLGEMRALIRGQMLLEPSVAKSPESQVTVAPIPNASGGGFAVSIKYQDADTSAPVSLNFNVAE